MDFKGGPMLVEWACLKSLQEVMTIDEAYYPDTIKHMFVINAPSYFSYLFSIIKPWMNPLDVKKIVILGEQKEFLPVLLKYIAEEEIPVEYGGKNVEFGWKPSANRDPLDFPAVSSPSSSSCVAVNFRAVSTDSSALSDPVSVDVSDSSLSTISSLRNSIIEIQLELKRESIIVSDKEIHVHLSNQDGNVAETIKLLKIQNSWCDGI
jgi:hypothetical protein